MNNKIYFEMSEAERQLHLISNNLDYAVCVLSEGLSGIPEVIKDESGGNVPSSEVVLYTLEHLTAAYAGADLLFKSLGNEK